MAHLARVITCSDGASRGERDDLSGPAVRDLLTESGLDAGEVVIVPDDVDAIASAIEQAIAQGACLVVTTGGTGIAPRDVTPEATMRVSERTIPGFGEVMRATSRMGPLSRALAATTQTGALIVNLPGSPRGAIECLRAVLHLIPHALELLGEKHVERHP